MAAHVWTFERLMRYGMRAGDSLFVEFAYRRFVDVAKCPLLSLVAPLECMLFCINTATALDAYPASPFVLLSSLIRPSIRIECWKLRAPACGYPYGRLQLSNVLFNIIPIFAISAFAICWAPFASFWLRGTQAPYLDLPHLRMRRWARQLWGRRSHKSLWEE